MTDEFIIFFLYVYLFENELRNDTKESMDVLTEGDSIFH
jgi:hypothetical protein